MAYGAKKIFPIDKKPRVAIGVGIPFNQPGVFSSTYLTQDAIKTNLINYFLTNAGERYMNPSFGGIQIDAIEKFNLPPKPTFLKIQAMKKSLLRWQNITIILI